MVSWLDSPALCLAPLQSILITVGEISYIMSLHSSISLPWLPSSLRVKAMSWQRLWGPRNLYHHPLLPNTPLIQLQLHWPLGCAFNTNHSSASANTVPSANGTLSPDTFMALSLISMGLYSKSFSHWALSGHPIHFIIPKTLSLLACCVVLLGTDHHQTK